MTVAAGPEFSELFATLPVAALVLDPEGRVAHANSECELLLNVSERAMLGQPLDGILQRPEGSEDRSDQGFAAYDTELETRAGRLPVDYIEAQIAERPGWRTITLHSAASRRMAQAADRATGARAAIGAAAMLAHEIKNPLSGIRGAAQLLAASEGGAGELTTLITTEVDRIAALIDGMQDFTDTRPPRLAAENIYPLLDHARRVALAGFAREVAIVERFDPSLPHAVIDRDMITQILLNLLKNAAEATAGQPERRITLATAYRHGMAVASGPGKPRQALPIEICVIDNGPGAPADIAGHLFEPFVSSKREGQGLGLALVDKLVRDNGGLVQYAREGVPESTVFRLLLPRASA